METVLFSAHAQLPEGTDIYQLHRSVSLILTVDIQDGKIVECSTPVYDGHTSKFIAAILEGKSLEGDLDNIIKEMERRLQIGSRRALITALQAIHHRYKLVKDRSNR